MIRRVLTILGLATSASVASITDCGSAFQITSLGLYPDPPVLGQQVYMDLQFNNNGPAISDGTVYTSLTYNGLPIAVDPKPLCEDTACPIQTGYNNRSTATTWPDSGTGKITSQIKWVSSGETLLCIQTVVKVGALTRTALRGSMSRADTDDTTGSSEPLPQVKDLTVWRAPMCPLLVFGPELAAEELVPRNESQPLHVAPTRLNRTQLRAHRNE
jgi:hypothetical protein